MESKVRLYKAFYKAHLKYFEDTGLVLSRYPIVRMPKGPGIDDGDALLNEMETHGLLKRSVGTPGKEREQVFELTSSLAVDPDGPEYRSILAATKWAQALRTDELSELTHQTSRSWKQGVDGQELDIYADHISDERVLRSRESAREMAARLSRSLGE